MGRCTMDGDVYVAVQQLWADIRDAECLQVVVKFSAMKRGPSLLDKFDTAASSKVVCRRVRIRSPKFNPSTFGCTRVSESAGRNVRSKDDV